VFQRWNAEAGYREVLRIAVPLILSQGAYSLQQFVDRIFLAWYSPEAVAAATPAGILTLTIMSLFFGTAGYVTSFVAQYDGAGRPERIGHALWQGIYIALLGGVVLALLAPAAPPIFAAVGHAPGVQANEVRFFRILCAGAAPAILNAALASFFSGRGRPWAVLWADVAAALLTVVLDWLLIFGRFGLPRLGIEGAAIATVAGSTLACLILSLLIFVPRRHRRYETLQGWRPDRVLLLRVIRYGLPTGIQIFIDLAGFTAFFLLVGRISTDSLAATNIALNINTLAFMPMLGLGTAVSVLVGRYIGEARADLAERSVSSAVRMALLYMGILSLAYLLVPGLFLLPFGAEANATTFAPIAALAKILLRFVAFYSLFDALNIVFSSAIKGAGDTRFVMLMIIVLSIGILIVPNWLIVVVLHGSIYAAWIVATTYISLLGVVFFIRYRGGKWKRMRVIEITPASAPIDLSLAPPDSPRGPS